MISDKKEAITVRIRKDILELLRNRAQQKGISTNAYITLLLADSLKNEKG